ncbi:MAG: hypothetical protein ACOC5A_02515 [Halanaerobiales bacterium]
MLNIILLVFFTALAVVSLVFRVEMGVFVGLTFIPWQILRADLGRQVHLVAIVVTSATGIVFFLVQGSWAALGLFVFLELYNLWHYIGAGANVKVDKNGEA